MFIKKKEYEELFMREEKAKAVTEKLRIVISDFMGSLDTLLVTVVERAVKEQDVETLRKCHALTSNGLFKYSDAKPEYSSYLMKYRAYGEKRRDIPGALVDVDEVVRRVTREKKDAESALVFRTMSDGYRCSTEEYHSAVNSILGMNGYKPVDREQLVPLLVNGVTVTDVWDYFSPDDSYKGSKRMVLDVFIRLYGRKK